MNNLNALRAEFVALRNTARALVGSRFNDMLDAAFADITNDGEHFADLDGNSVCLAVEYGRAYVAAAKLVIERGQRAQKTAAPRRDWFFNIMADRLAAAHGIA